MVNNDECQFSDCDNTAVNEVVQKTRVHEYIARRRFCERHTQVVEVECAQRGLQHTVTVVRVVKEGTNV